MTNKSCVNGWTLYQHPLFKDQLTSIKKNVIELKKSDPENYKSHPETKLLASLFKAIKERVPNNPDDPEFRQGHTLGKDNNHWRRVKNGMPNRYRLFFRFRSAPPPSIIYAWINDDETLRKAGAKTDCYEVFKNMLKRGVVPQSIKELIETDKTRD
ncbi:hypothetical protein MNBD_GAMMA10-1222 [hydrothermal vent metagenome]|uniref:Toxin YhaV n=1 Tax=hydrothermal vent metagenome TaxID=652676 RepID=A0A3B0XCQ6_9ZZZZ